MKNIEIKTAQNVVLQYELAGLRDRAIAYFIDLAILLAGISLLAFTGSGLTRTSDTVATIFVFFLLSIFIFYSIAMEIFNHGRTVGKMAMRIQVIKTNGGEARFEDYAARWVFRMVDIYLSFGGIASILVASSAKEQRIGDIVANTTVIKVQPRMNMNLDDLLAIHAPVSYVPHYTAVKQLPEEDMLLIKSVLDRDMRYNNLAHQRAIHLLAEKVKAVLHVENKEPDEKKFLQAVLKDYVMLTR